MNSNLTPEQRPDKNGNVVTRWVRGIFNRTKKESRPIPKVTLSENKPVQRKVMSRLEAETLNGRLMDQTLSYGAEGVNVNMRDRTIIHQAYENHRYDAMLLMERLGATHGYQVASDAAIWMEDEGLEDELSGITGAQLDAFNSFNIIAMETSLQHPDENGRCTKHFKIAPVFCHVLMHPEDGPLLENVVSGGVFDTERTFAMLKEIKEGNLPEALSEGFL